MLFTNMIVSIFQFFVAFRFDISKLAKGFWGVMSHNIVGCLLWVRFCV
jgi:hypothetical protein